MHTDFITPLLLYKKRISMSPWLCVVALLSLCLLTDAARFCERSGYCSVGKLKGYIGPLDTAAQLKDALNATAFKNELIIIAESRIGDASQALHRFRSAGYAHVLIIMEEPVQCQQLRSVFAPWLSEEGPISCGTYATSDPVSGVGYRARFKYFKEPLAIMACWRKFLTAGRAVALGYNVMAVDTDTLVLDDWYWRAKQPPLSEYNMMCQNEWGLNLNSGFCYVQNAASNGPSTWILYETVHRVVRWLEDDSVLRNASARYRATPILRINDQGLLQEAVQSAVVGRPIFPTLLVLYGDEKETYQKYNTTEDEMFRANINPFVAAFKENTEHPVTGELAGAVCEDFTKPECPTSKEGMVALPTADIRVPHSGGQWPLKLGGYPFSREIGNFTAAYRSAYAELGVPLPPDPDDPATEAQAGAIKPEKFAYLSHQGRDGSYMGNWALSGWWTVGRHGWWHTHLLPKNNTSAPRKLAIGHIWAGIFHGDFQKDIILMLSGHYNWQLATRVARGRRYMTNQVLPPGEPHHTAPEVRTVVAYKPGVVHAGMSKEQYIRAVQGLAQVAVALSAVAAWPAVPCDSDWALTPEARKSLPRPIKHSIPWSSYLDVFYQVQPFGDSLEELQCEWPGFAQAACICNHHQRPGQEVGQEVGQGMLAVEFAHLRKAARADPSPSTTLLLGDPAPPLPPAGNTERQPVSYADLFRLNAESVLRRQQREMTPVFWLDRLVEVVGMQGEAAATYKRWYDKCRALRYYELPEREREKW